MHVMQKKNESQAWPLKIKNGSVTVKIYPTRNRGREAYTIAYHEAGRRTRRMFAELSKAKAEAKIIAQQLSAGKGAALELTGVDRDSYLSAISKLKPLGLDLS